MSTKNIMLVCAAGMSTSMLVEKMKESAAENGHDVNVFAVGASSADDNLAKKEISALLLGPQVRYMESQFKEKVKDKNIPVAVINMMDYGTMNGEKVLQAALDLMEE